MSKIEHIITKEEDKSFDCIYIENEVFTYKATGLTRRVYENASKTFVIKVEINQSEYSGFNKEEIDIFENAYNVDKQHMAKTEVLSNGYIKQEFLWSLDDPRTEEFLEEKGITMSMKDIRFAKSCRNDVGFDKDGNLKCFDLAEYKHY